MLLTLETENVYKKDLCAFLGGCFNVSQMRRPFREEADTENCIKIGLKLHFKNQMLIIYKYKVTQLWLYSIFSIFLS